MRIFFGPLGEGALLALVPPPGLLVYFAPTLQYFSLPLYLILYRPLYCSKRVEIFDLYFGSKGLTFGSFFKVRPLGGNRNISFQPYLPFFHISLGHF